MVSSSLATALSSHFGRNVQQRGASYHLSGRVKIVSGSASSVSATVRGTDAYQVDLLRKGAVIKASCTCPYFFDDDDGACKHLWAAILAADERRYLRGGGSLQRLRLALDGDPAHVEEYEDELEDIEDDAAFDAEIDDSDDSFDRPIKRKSPPLNAAKRSSRAPRPPTWRARLAQLARPSAARAFEQWPATRELLYVIDATPARCAHDVRLDAMYRDRKRNGDWSKPVLRSVPREMLTRLPDAADRRILAFLAGASDMYGEYYGSTGSSYFSYRTPLGPRYRLTEPQPSEIVPELCLTGRYRLRLNPSDEASKWLPLRWEDGEPWRFRLQVQREHALYVMRGALWRGAERMDLSTPLVMLSDGVLFTRDYAARYDHGGTFNWIAALRDPPELKVPIDQSDEFVKELLTQCTLPPLDLPDELRYDEAALPPQPRLLVKPSPHPWERQKVRGEIGFAYDGNIVAHDDPRRSVLDAVQRRVLVRDSAAEQAAQSFLVELGWRTRRDDYGSGRVIELSDKYLPRSVHELTAAGWHVEAHGRRYRRASQFEFKVGSGVDWFDLHALLQFDDAQASLPKLLEAVRRGESAVRLDDGTLGLLPEEWLKKYGPLVGLGEAHGDGLRFKRNQVGLLDALLAAQPHVTCDAAFTQARHALQTFSGVQPLAPPAGFRGELRPYQREGLGWLKFLREFAFGGCLADDMGLGKTVQVLALLEERRALRASDPRIGPSLAVVPKSLVFNWQREAAHFAPQLRVLDHTGALRVKGARHFNDYDLLLTTYGTLRNDAEAFKDMRFDYVILDEAQAIKNAKSESAKAARLLQADHRLALSGTPIENHLGELWSLFEFLNPGMLGAASAFKLAPGNDRSVDESTRQMLSQALRPFFLRRTKTQVLPDLPPKVEQTLYCELDAKQRKLYDELRAHYRASLMEHVANVGIARAKIRILEALLRLRQAAIHPGLLDNKRVRESSAKLDLLLPQLQEALDEGHKTLVFSQFTGMLAILRDRLDREGIVYEYLDGKTRDREARVQRFQTDADCKLFLISLKAGGTGLNLTAAQYVFLLDPWWNPAVEAQAIDRAHRIGQAHRVFAYRLIARDTIEEKVLQLQDSKRELADAILGAGDGMLRGMGKEELQLLLS